MSNDAPTRIAVLGGGGRMGRMLVSTVLETSGAALAAVTERRGAAILDEDAGRALGFGRPLDIFVSDDFAGAIAAADIAIDFTSPAATLAHAEAAATEGKGLVIGTTGFSDADLAALETFAARTPIVRAGNMSLGVNLLTQLTERVARALGVQFDIEVVEAHHNQKVDAPSGTALMLGEAAARGRGAALAEVADRGRDGITGARKPGSIGFAAIRGGDVVGEHDVIFAAPGERVVLRHLATDRAIFARGAVTAALWLKGRPPGAYDMIDVLGLTA